MPSTGARTTRLRSVAAWRFCASASRSRSALAALSSPSRDERHSRARPSCWLVGLGERGAGGRVLGLGLVEVADQIAELALERDQAQARVQALVRQSPDRLELLGQQPLAVVQPDQIGRDRGELVAPLADLVGEAFGAAGVGLAAALEQRLLLRDQAGPGGGELGIDHQRLPPGLGLEPRRLGALDLEATGELGELGPDQLRIEGHQRLAGHDPLALDHVHLGDPAAVRMVDDLDPAGRLDLAIRLHHLVDLGQRRPTEQAAEHARDRQDQEAGDRRMAALDHALGIGQELGEPLGAAGAGAKPGEHRLRPARGAAAAAPRAADGSA